MTTETIHVGWDIGIKNLSHCLINKLSADPGNSMLNVLKIGPAFYQVPADTWDIIDFSKGAYDKVNERGEMMLIQRPVVLCKFDTAKMKNGTSLCNKSASFCRLDKMPDGSYYGYCANHFKKSLVPKTDIVPAKIGTCKCYTPACDSKAWYLDRDHVYTGYCKKHYNLMISSGTRQAEQFYKVIKSKSATTLDLTSLTESLYAELNKRPALSHATQILLENQPVLKNPTMKTIQSLLYGYFVIKSRMEPITQPQINDKIQCYFAANKLELVKYVDNAGLEAMKTVVDKSKDGYAKNKVLAILLVNYYLDKCGINADALKAKFSACNKQDDMADSLLMTLHALEKHNLAKIKSVDVSSVGINKRKKNSVPASTDEDVRDAVIEPDVLD